MKKIQLQIPEPCSENWNVMTPTEKGRFCMQCTKEVIDFSLMSDLEIMKALKASNSPVCGRIVEDQLNRQLQNESRNGTHRWKYFWQLLIPVFLIARPAFAQGKPRIDTIQVAGIQNSKTNIPATEICQLPPTDNSSWVIARVVNSQNSEPLPGATVFINSSRIIVTNDSGYFTIPWKAVIQELEISCVGYEKKKIAIDANTDEYLTIQLSPAIRAMEEVVLHSGGPYVRGAIRMGAVCSVSVVERIREFVFPGKASAGIYPNPVRQKSTARLKFSSTEAGDFLLTVFDSQGRQVLTKKLSYPAGHIEEPIHIGNQFSQGVYILKLQNRSGSFVHTSRFVVQ